MKSLHELRLLLWFAAPLLAWFLIAILFTASLSACGPALPAYTPTLPALPTRPAAIQTVPPSPTASPTPAPSTETPLLHPGWTSFPEFGYVRDMVFDQAGNLWAAGPFGLVRIRPDGALARITTRDGLPSNDILSAEVDSQGDLWFGTRGAGVVRFDGQSWQTSTTADNLAGNEVSAIANRLDIGEILVGTQNGLSVHTYDETLPGDQKGLPDTPRRWATYRGPAYLPDDGVRAIAVTPGGSIWIGTKNGLVLFGPGEVYTAASGLASDVVNAMVIAPDCSLWIGTSRGVSHYHGETWTSYTSAGGLASDWISAAAATLDGALWFGIRAGVSRFDGQNWINDTTADGLADNDVLSIAVAPDDSLWFGTAGGLTHYSPSLEPRSGEPDFPQNGSASALQVVYLKDGNLWLWSAGMKVPVTRDGRVSSLKLSGDGRKVAFTRLNDGLENELWVIDRDGTDERLLIGPQDLAALSDLTETEQTRKWDMKVVLFHYEWVPGQYTLAYDTRRQFEGVGTLYHDDLRLVNAVTGERTTLLPSGRGGRFAYSPDGSQIAIVTPKDISIVSADGSHWRERLLEYPEVLAYREAPYYPAPVWSSDSQFLRLALPPRDPMGYPPEPTVLWHIPADGSPPTRLGSISPAQFFNLSVSFIPDLTRLAYLTSVGQPDESRRQLHLANGNGSGDGVVAEGVRLRFWGWSPDGLHFIYSFGDPEAWYIGSMNGDAIPLTFHPQDLIWVDSESFLHVENLGCALELRLTRLTGESQVIDRMWKTPVSFTFAYR